MTAVLLLSGLTAYADARCEVSAEAVSAEQGEMITVPLRISSSDGLMGFRISVKYPDNQLTLTDVSSGSVTADGLFNTTITDYYSVKGSFDVVWSSSAEVKDDGTLFVMTYKVKETADDGEYNISVTYSQEDTFDEKFEDVKLSCSPIKVYVGNVTIPPEETEAAAEPETTTKQADDKKSGEAVADDYLIASVEQILQSFGGADLDTLTEEQQSTVLAYVNNRVDSYGGGKKYDSFDALKTDFRGAVKREAARKITESTDPDKIVSITDEVLKEYGASTFRALPADKKEEAVNKTLQQLAEVGADEEGFAHLATADDAAEALDEAVSTARGEQDQTVTPVEAEGRKTVIIAIAASIAGLAFIIAIVIMIKKRRNKHEK